MSFEQITCTICRTTQPLDQFGIRKNSIIRFRQCRSCKSRISSLWNREHSISRLTVSAASRAKKFGLLYEIDNEWVLANIQNQCPCCGKQYLMGQPNGHGRARERRPSLDRFDSSLGYTKKNTRIICFKCNRTKNEGDAQDHENIMRWIMAGGPMTSFAGLLNGDGI